MPKKTPQRLSGTGARARLAVLVCLLAGAVASARTFHYESGLVRLVLREGPSLRQSRDAALDALAREMTPDRSAGFAWRELDTVEDSTHAHRLYELQYRGRRVVDHFLKAHWNRKGFVDFATSGWEFEFDVEERRAGPGEAALKAALVAEARAKWGRFEGEMETTPVVWVDRTRKVGVPAIEVKIASARPRYLRHFFVDEATHEILEEKTVFRNAARDVYRRFPDGTGTNFFTAPGGDFSGVTLQVASKLHVKRLQDTVSATPDEEDVDPGQDYSSSITTDPATYNYTCNAASCPNQQFDAVNVYWHIKKYRDSLDSIFTALGVSPDLALGGSTVLNALVNAFDVDSDLDGSDDEANNAFYGSLVLRNGSVVTGGLFFLRPAMTSASSPICPSAQFFDLAREALVIVHEYQHYITDRITRMVSGSYEDPLIGDAFHEGFSDYMGATQVTAESGTATTEIGEYAFQNCQDLRRDIATLKVFVNSSSSEPENDFSDPHIGGWTWASGLWQLRTELGATTVDRMAIKSLFFFSPRPGFIEGVEALVKADQELNSGVNARRIRQLFYRTLNFLGPQDSSVFRDLDNFVIETGFRSCLGVSVAGAGPPWASLVLVALWLVALRVAGRFGRRE